MQQQSPIREIRQRRGWRAADLARFAGMSLGAVTMVERGELVKLPARLESALVRLGEDVIEVRRRHEQFVTERRRSLTTRSAPTSE